MAETQVLGWGTQSAPASRETAGSHAMELLAIDATFDGTGAAGSFVPAVKIISDAGEEVGAFPLGSSLAAGDSATVTFAPFLRGTQLVASSSSSPVGFYNAIPVGGNPVAGGAADPLLAMTFAGAGAGTDLLDTTVNGTPSGPVVKHTGVYAIIARIGFDPNPVGPFPANINGALDITVQNEPPPEDFFAMETTQVFPLDNTLGSGCFCTVEIVRFLSAESNPSTGFQFFQVKCFRPAGQALNVNGTVQVQKVF